MRQGTRSRDLRARLFQLAAMIAVLICIAVILAQAGGDRGASTRLTDPVPLVGIP